MNDTDKIIQEIRHQTNWILALIILYNIIVIVLLGIIIDILLP